MVQAQLLRIKETLAPPDLAWLDCAEGHKPPAQDTPPENATEWAERLVPPPQPPPQAVAPLPPLATLSPVEGATSLTLPPAAE